MIALGVWVDRASNTIFSSSNNNSTTDETTMNSSFEKNDEKKVAITTKNDHVDILESSTGISVKKCWGMPYQDPPTLFPALDAWTDYLRVLVVRVFQKNIVSWLSNPTHLYYVNYLSIKKIRDTIAIFS